MEKEEGYNVSETGNWNVARNYSEIKIMSLLKNIDIYENISRYGHDTLLEQIISYSLPKDQLRLMGIERLVNTLLQLINNVKFAIKKKGTAEQLKGFEEQLLKIKPVLPFLFVKRNNHIAKTSTIVIKEKEFNKILDMVIEIKAGINEPINKNNLIFNDKEEFDPQEYKKKVKEDAINLG